jgi:CRISPR/Cas system-associated exonuclease Cas4 (RecB family)
MKSFQVTELVMAARCPRQLVLHRLGHTVVPEGDAGIGRMAHAALEELAASAERDPDILAALEPQEPNADAVRDACWRLAYAHTYARALRAVSGIDGEALMRLDGILRSLAGLMATLFVRARAQTSDARDAVRSAIVASEQPVSMVLGGIRVTGRFDLLCHDASTDATWLWDLKTYTNADRAQQEQVRLYALALQAHGIEAKAALLHITDESVAVVDAPPLGSNERERVEQWLVEVAGWQEEEATPPAADEDTCRGCPAQEPCWARWGRTLPDADQAPRRSALAPSARPIAAGATVRAPTEADAERPDLSPPTIWLGEERGTGRAACLEPADLTRHVAVLGTTGSGKTCLAKTIVEEATLSGIPSLVLDVQGDLAQFAALGKGGKETLAVRRSAFAELAELRLLTPASDAGLRVSLNPLRLPDEGLNDEASGFCRVAMAEALLGAVRVPDTWRDLAREYVAQVLETPSGAGSLSGLVHQLRNPTELRREPLVRSRTRREALAEQLRLLSEGTQRFLYERGRRLDIQELVAPFTPGKVPINVVWLPGLGDAQMRQRFVATVLSDVYAWMLRHPSSTPQLLVYLDEVGPFMPPIGEPPAKRVLMRIFKEGRKYGVCGLFCTQNFTDVDYKALSQAGTLLLGRLGSTQDKARVRKMLPTPDGFDPAGAAEMLTGAGVGRFLVSNVDRFGAPRVMQARMPLTHHARPWGEDEIRTHTSDEIRARWLTG